MPLIRIVTALRLCAIAFGLSLTNVCAQAGMFAVSATTDMLYRVDPGSGNFTEIGPLGYGDIQMLAFHPNGTLYGVDHTADDLVTIDTSTGTASKVADIPHTIVPNSIAFNSAGVLYGMDNGFGRTIKTYDITTGDMINQVGSTTFTMSGLAFLPNGELRAASTDGHVFQVNPTVTGPPLLDVDPLTGDATPLGPMNFGSSVGIVGDLTLGPSNQLYAIAAFVPDASLNGLIRLDSASGSVTPITGGFVPNGLSGLAYFAEVPAPATLVLLLAGVLGLLSRDRWGCRPAR